MPWVCYKHENGWAHIPPFALISPLITAKWINRACSIRILSFGAVAIAIVYLLSKSDARLILSYAGNN